MAMCYAIAFAFLLSQGLQRDGWLRQAARLTFALGATAALAAVLGFYGDGLSTGHYGEYRMSLDAPWCDAGYSMWACPKGGGYEASHYLGCGALVLTAIALGLTFRLGLARMLRRHAALVGVMLLLTLFAITHRVRFGPHLIASWPLPFS